jgi:hypothetical protein
MSHATRTIVDNGLNYIGDTLMHCGAILLGRHAARSGAAGSSADQWSYETRACPNLQAGSF